MPVLPSVDRALTQEQKIKIREIIRDYPESMQRQMILTEVLTSMTPPEGVTREFDTHGRCSFYDGALASYFARDAIASFS